MTENRPAETMRRAAALMRERAQAVQHFTSPWRTAGPAKRDEWREQSDEWRVMYATDHPAAGLIATTADYGTCCLPDHIASWHPLIALAVADWLEHSANDASGAPVNDDGSLVTAYCDEPGAVQSALKVARAYLDWNGADTVTGIQPAPKLLAQLAAEMRADWPYDETRAALIAASQAGWDTERIYRETFRLLLLADSSPADLRQASRNPLRPVPAAGDGTLERGLAAAREALEHRHPADSDPEGGEAA